MNRRFLAFFKRREIYLIPALIGIVFIGASATVAWLLRNSIVPPPYEAMTLKELKDVFACGYLRFREDDGTPYLKVEIHNGTLWWIKKVEFDFDGTHYILNDRGAFRPLHFGAQRCVLKTPPSGERQIVYDLKLVKAFGYPPAQARWERKARRLATEPPTNPRSY
ncbi:MAG: hypothetical protein AB1646_13245 [Thermodesulfobacteriota bacterium]